MRPLCIILVILFIGIGLLGAKEDTTQTKKLIKLIYSEDGYLANAGEEDILRVEITSPFYRYIGNMPRGKMVDISDIKTKFTVQYTARQWLGGYEIMTQSFIPVIGRHAKDAGLDIKAELRKNVLIVDVKSESEISDIFIEILSDIPIKISNDRVRYILSSVGAIGQNLKRGPNAEFKLTLLNYQEFYIVPIQITYVFEGRVYNQVFTFSFKTGDFIHAP